METEFRWQVAGEEWGENEKDWVEKVSEKKLAAVFSYDSVMREQVGFLCFSFP